jgi:hypothetical protein
MAVALRAKMVARVRLAQSRFRARAAEGPAPRINLRVAKAQVMVATAG